MRLTSLGQSLVTQWHHDGEKRPSKNLLNVMNEKSLKGSRSFREYRTRRVSGLEVLRDFVCVRENLRSHRGTKGIDDDGKCIERAAIASHGAGESTDGAKRCFDVGKFDPYCSIWETFIIEDEAEEFK